MQLLFKNDLEVFAYNWGEIRLGGGLPNSKELHHTGTDPRVSPSLHLILAFFELSFTGDSVVNIWGEELENPIFF